MDERNETTIEDFYGTPRPEPEPVVMPARRAPRRALLLALPAVLLAGVAVAVGASLLTSPPATVAGWFPAGPFLVAEANLAPSPAQILSIIKVAERFPAFRDKTAENLESELDKSMSQSLPNFHLADVRAWLGGAAGVAAYYPATATSSAIGSPRIVGAVAIRDRAAAESWLRTNELLDREIAVDGEVLWTLRSADNPLGALVPSLVPGTDMYEMTPPSDADRLVVAVRDRVLLVGQQTEVLAALATKGEGSVPADPEYRAALAAVGSDRLGYFFATKTPLADLAKEQAEALAAFESLPSWGAGALRVRDDAIAFDTVYPHDASIVATDHADRLAAHLPGDAIVALEVGTAGPVIAAQLERTFAQMPSDSVAQARELVGDLAFLGDLAVAIVPTDSLVAATAVAEVGDGTAAQALIDRLAKTLSLEVADLGTLGEVRTRTIGASGSPAVAYAIADGRLYLATDPALLPVIVAPQAADTLAASASWMTDAKPDEPFSSLVYIDPSKTLDAVERLSSSLGGSSDSMDELRENLRPIRSVIARATRGSELDRSSVSVLMR